MGASANKLIIILHDVPFARIIYFDGFKANNNNCLFEASRSEPTLKRDKSHLPSNFGRKNQFPTAPVTVVIVWQNTPIFGEKQRYPLLVCQKGDNSRSSEKREGTTRKKHVQITITFTTET